MAGRLQAAMGRPDREAPGAAPVAVAAVTGAAPVAVTAVTGAAPVAVAAATGAAPVAVAAVTGAAHVAVAAVTGVYWVGRTSYNVGFVAVEAGLRVAARRCELR